MSGITAASVKELREKTGAGMMDCKKALTESGGDMDAAVDWLRKKGLAAAQKKAGRTAAEGLVGVSVNALKGAVVEVNSETDFVARNDMFRAFVGKASELALEADSVEALQKAAYPETGRSVEEELTHMISVVGENMALRRCKTISVSQGTVASYIHNAAAPGMGQIGVLVGLESSADAGSLEALGKQIAMHIAATRPQSVSTADLDPTLIEKEREVLSEQARASGKPEEIIAKMVEGRLTKFYQEVVLLEQVFVIDGETPVKTVVENAAKELGADIKVSDFVLYRLGEGIEKKETDFAAEVAEITKS